MGRKTKLTDERQQLIVAALKAGNYIDTACDYAGISHQSFYNWMEQGEAAQRGKFFEFFEAVQKARSEAEMRNVNVVQKAAQGGTWQAAAWHLERSFPER